MSEARKRDWLMFSNQPTRYLVLVLTGAGWKATLSEAASWWWKSGFWLGQVSR
jgi:hypothetical protein